MKVLGMGNALVDIMTRLKSDDILKKFKLPRGSMTLVDLELSNLINIQSSGLEKTMASGGSAANTIHGLAKLGMETGYIGKIGKDDLGKIFKKDMKKSGINTILYQSMNDTGRVIAMISPDSERTMATYLGAAVELSAEDISSDIFMNYDLFYIEGYLVNNFELFSKSLRIARKNGLKTALDLASFNVVEQYKDQLCEELRGYVDIVFANEDESKVLTGEEPGKAVNTISNLADIAVVKLGANGSIIKQGSDEVHVPAPLINSIDTTGAGDIYASGFLYGQSKGLSLKKCGQLGTLLASEVIQVIGPKLDNEAWKRILEKTNEIILE